MFLYSVLYNVIECLNNLFLLQEAFADLARDESLIFELLELKHDVEDNGSAAHFFHDLATEQDAEGVVVILMFSFILFPNCLSFHKSLYLMQLLVMFFFYSLFLEYLVLSSK